MSQLEPADVRGGQQVLQPRLQGLVRRGRGRLHKVRRGTEAEEKVRGELRRLPARRHLQAQALEMREEIVGIFLVNFLGKTDS